LEDFNSDYQQGIRRDVLAHLAGCSFIAKAENVILLGPPGVGKTHVAIGLGKKARHASYPVAFDTQTANLFFQLVAARHLQGSILITSNLSFGRWGEVFGGDTVASAMIDRQVHHAEVLPTDGESYRTRTRREMLSDSETGDPEGSVFSRR
jgi:DNA replication protein DnaC